MRSDDLCDPEQAFIGRRMPRPSEDWSEGPGPDECRYCGAPAEMGCDCPVCHYCGEFSDDLADYDGDLICAACRAEYGRA